MIRSFLIFAILPLLFFISIPELEVGAQQINNCCNVREETGCDNSVCEDIICGFDSFCCDNSWDEQCVNEALVLCSECLGPPTPPPGDCCTAHEGAGCNDFECIQTVCNIDSNCCFVSWDDQCANDALESCAECTGPPPSGPTVVIPTLSQWGMIFTAVLLGLYALIRLRRKASE